MYTNNKDKNDTTPIVIKSVPKPVYKTLENGKYIAKIDNVYKKEATGGYPEQLSFVFSILNKDFVGTRVYGSVTPTYSIKSKLYMWLLAMGVMLDEGTEFNVKSVVGKEVQIDVTKYQNKKGEYRNKVTNLYPLPKAYLDYKAEQARKSAEAAQSNFDNPAPPQPEPPKPGPATGIVHTPIDF